MLVLSRKKNQRIVIDDDIEIMVVEIRGDKVRLGIKADKKIPVHRREVYDAIHRSAAANLRKQTEPAPQAVLDALQRACEAFSEEDTTDANATKAEAKESATKPSDTDAGQG